MALATASVAIIPDLSGFTGTLQKDIDKALKGVEDTVERTTSEIEKDFKDAGDKAGQAANKIGDDFKKLGKLIAGAAISRSVFNFAKQSIDAASDLGESINAVQVTFGELSDEILAFSKTSATSVGLASADFNSFAVRFAGFTKQIATGSKTAADVTFELTARIADFASVMNLDLNEAATVFASTLAGESEAIRRFGIDMSAASIEAFALSQGLISSKDEMTASIKVQATYQKLMADTNQVAGDFANTSDSLANRQRILAAEMKNLQVEVGTALVPVMESLLSVVGPVLNTFNALPSGLQKTITYAVLAGGAFLGLSSALQGVGISAGTANRALGKIGIILTGVSAIMAIFGKSMDNASEDSFETFVDAIKSTDAALRESALLEFAKESPELQSDLKVWGELGLEINDLNEYFRTGSGPVVQFKDAMNELNRAIGPETGMGAYLREVNDLFGTNYTLANTTQAEYEALRSAFESASYAIHILGTDYIMTQAAAADLEATTEDTNNAVGRSKIVYNEAGRAIMENTEAIIAQDEALGDLLDATLAMFSNEIAFEQAKRSTNDAILAYTSLLADVQTGSYDGSDALRDLAEAEEEVYLNALDQAAAAADLAEETALASGDILTNAEKTDIQREALQKVAATLAPGSPLRKQLDEYISRLNAIPRNIESNVRINVTQSGQTYVTTPYGSMPVMAQGGIVAAPQVAMIGEAGAEAVIPLTKPGRALELMRESGLLGLAQQSAPSTSQNFDITVMAAEPIRTASDVVREFQALEYRMAPI
jgi:hypothetical protein